MKKIAIFILTALVAWSSATTSASAKDLTRYATKTVELKEAASKDSQTVTTVKMNTKLKVTAQGKTWVTVNYNGQTLYAKKAELHKTKAVNKWKGRSFKKRGRGRWNKCSWTWYSTRQRCGRVKGVKGKHINSRGFVLDKDGYIVLASGRGNKKKHKIVPTPFGRYGKVYDTNGGYNKHWFDVYVNW